MSNLSGPSTITRLSDVILGCFRCVEPSGTLDHLVRFLGTWNGTDKLFMVAQYAIKLIVPFLRLRARLQHRAGLRPGPKSSSVEGYTKLYSLIGDTRTLWRFWGLLPIIQWLISLERSPQPTRNLHAIERLQGWAMLAYYPLEHLSYLGTHEIIPTAIRNPVQIFTKRKTISLDPGILGLWSCRFWAMYIFLQFAHLREDYQLLQLRQRALRKAKGTGLTASDKQELAQRWDAWWSEVIVTIGYLPLTIHWSLKRGLFKDDIWIAVFGLVAGVTSFRSGWRATALPSPSASTEKTDKQEHSSSTGYDVSSL